MTRLTLYSGGRRQLSPEETAANARARADRAAASMTCQCCGRRYLASTGTIAHHGYQRPGGGWQTASCMGAKSVPFEVSRDRLGELIVGLKGWEARAVEALAEVEAERMPVHVEVLDRTGKRDRFGRRPTKTVVVTRDTFEAVKASEDGRDFLSYGFYNFDCIKQRDTDHRRHELKGAREEIRAQKARFDGWTQTHDWEAATKTWKAI